MIGLCDCNNFFVSCERVFNPSLCGRAVIVLSSNDGCVIARSNESKALGIKMGQPLYQIRDIVNTHQIVLHSSNYQLYGDMSQRVMETLRDYVPSIEVYSIDEAFLDLESIPADELKLFGEQLSKRVKRNTGIPVSIGIAPTKTLAKIASRLCKQYPKLNGACLLYREEDIKKVLTKFPISDVWGIGRRFSKMLRDYGIDTAEEFRETPQEWVRGHMGITGLRTWKELHGEAAILFDDIHTTKQSITVSRSFAKEIYDVDSLCESLSTFVAKAAEKLRNQKSVAGHMQVFASTNRHREDQMQHSENLSISFPTPTDSTLEFIKEASKLLRTLFVDGCGYKKCGVILYDIQQNSGIQSSLFDDVDRDKHKRLMTTLDSINSHYGNLSVKIGSQGKGTPKSSSEHLSPQYTTDWNDILVVKVDV